MYTIEAEMAASVRRVLTHEGAVVEMGDIVILLESMKLEIPVETIHPGTVDRVYVSEGDAVGEGQLLVGIRRPNG